MNSCLLESGHNTNNHPSAERTAVYSILITNRITILQLNEQLFIRLCCQAVKANKLLNNQLPTTSQLHTP